MQQVITLNLRQYAYRDRSLCRHSRHPTMIFTSCWPRNNAIFRALSHYDDVTMSLMVSQITSLTIVCSTVNSAADQRKHQSSASLAFVRGIHRGPANSPHKWPVTRKMFPFDDVIMVQPHWLYMRWDGHKLVCIYSFQVIRYRRLNSWKVTPNGRHQYTH